ncbi:MAG: protein kinase [Nannocystis sp.]|nr:serine/threonine-protein kinase [Nannocystis sp.]MBA3549911.1 protein kinase [Nannocystis sp.]
MNLRDDAASGPPDDASDGACGTGPAPPEPTGPERYERLGILGVGGMGRVYLARDRWLGRMVALKEAHDDALARRLAREVRVTASLEHPGIVTVYDEARGADGRLFYTMRLMRGRPLSRVLVDRHTVAARLELLGHYLDACQALAYAHAQGVIHRDLKPTNIMIGAFGETQVVDWGLARPLADAAADDGLDSDTTHPGAVLGTPAYMSPEQARGEPADRRADVWGLGVVLHELLSGAPPTAASDTHGSGVAITASARAPARTGVASNRTRALPRGVPAELAAIVARAMAFEPDARYADAGALASDVAAYLAGRRVHAHHYSALEIGLRFVRAWRGPLLVACAALLVIATLLVLGSLRLRAQRDRAFTAEGEARTALAASDRNLATALVAQARAVDDEGADALKEVLAAHALRLIDSPEARGVLAGARAAARPTRLATAVLPACFPLVALAVDDIVCADGQTVRRMVAGVERWRATMTRPTKELRVEAGRVWAVGHGFSLTTLSLATGAPDDGWEILDFNVGDAWPLRSAAWGPGPAQPQIASGCPDSSVAGVDGSVDGRFVVLCSDGRLGWATGASLPTVALALDRAEFVTFTHLKLAPDGERVVVAGTRGRVAVHERATHRTWSLAPTRAGAVRKLALSPAGERLAIARERGGVELYTLPELRPIGGIPASNVHDLRLFDDGSVLVAGPRVVTQWALPGSPRPAIFADAHGLSSVAFAPDGRTLVTTHGEGRVLVWDRETGVRRHVLEISTDTVKASAFMPDGERFAVIDAGAKSYGPRVFDSATGALQWSLPPDRLPRWLQGRRVAALAGNVVIVALYGSRLLAVDIDTEEELATVDCPEIEWQDLAGVPGWGRVALVSVDGAVFVLEAGAPPLRCRPVPAPAGTQAADVSADGHAVIVGGSRFLARIGPDGLAWTVAHPGVSSPDVSLSPDGRWVASAGPDTAARVWDAETGALRAVLTGHDARVSSVDFSADSRTLATGSWDGAARLWDLGTLDVPAEMLVSDAEVTWGLTLADALGG